MVGLSLGEQVVLSQHVGDLDNLPAVELHRRTIADLFDFFRAPPEAVACDLHPDYASTREAESLAARAGRAPGPRAAPSRRTWPRACRGARAVGTNARPGLGRHGLWDRRHGLGR